MRDVMQSNAAATERILDDVLKAREDWGGVAVGVGVGVALVLAVIWVGWGLCTSRCWCIGGLVVVPLSLMPATKTYGVIGGGLIAPTLAFAALLRVRPSRAGSRRARSSRWRGTRWRRRCG